jgi:hypothetical protein
MAPTRTRPTTHSTSTSTKNQGGDLTPKRKSPTTKGPKPSECFTMSQSGPSGLDRSSNRSKSPTPSECTTISTLSSMSDEESEDLPVEISDLNKTPGEIHISLLGLLYCFPIKSISSVFLFYSFCTQTK